MDQILFIITILSSAAATDICTSRASLVQIEEFYLQQSFSSEVELDLSNYIEELQSIEANAEKFASIAVKYDTEKELDDLEPSALYPLTPELNIFAINSTHQDYMTDCEKLKSKILEFSPTLAPTIKALLKTLELPNTALKTFNDRQNTLTNLEGDLYHTDPKPTSTQIRKMQDYYALFTAEGSITYPADDLTQAAKIAGFCMKPNNIWDHKGPLRHKWLSTIRKILPSISTAKSWSNILSTVISQLPIQASLYKKMTDKLILNTPLPLTRIKNFLSKFNTDLKWESSLTSDLPLFLQYLTDFTEVIRSFQQTPAPTQAPGNQPLSPTPAPFPLMSIAAIDKERLQRFINMDPTKINITGPINAIPLFKHEESGKITAKTVFHQYGESDLVRIFHVKPVIYQDTVTTITHVIGTHRNYLATMVPPTPFGCSKESATEQNIRICKGYTTPGLSILPPQDSIDCGNSLANDDSETSFSKCPTKLAPTFPTAHRAQCHDSSVVVTSPYPLSIRIYCDNLSTRPIKLDTFPSYLNTECEIKIIDKGGEIILLPQDTSKFLQERNLAIIAVTLPPVITNPTLRPTSVTQSAPTIAPILPTATVSVPDYDSGDSGSDESDWIAIAFFSICGLVVVSAITIVCYLCFRLKCCKSVMKKSRPACCSSSCKDEPSKNCCCWCQSDTKNASGDADLELIEKIIVKPYFTDSDKDTTEKPEMKQLLADQATTSFSIRPVPASAPLEEGAFRDPEHIRIQQELSKTREIRQTMNNQLTAQSKF